ncbi:MAG: HEAT repeat domain-containing protein [Bryobacterales bacterium]|nr:HEAT repeat domain-containing protein [Bryobacterales bacterium]
MNCDQAKERMVDRWIAGLDEAQRIELDRHIGTCPHCREEHETLLALWNGLGGLPVEEPGRAMRAGFHRMLEAYRLGAASGQVARPSAWEWLKDLWPRQPLVQFALAAAALVCGVLAGHLYTARGHDREQIAALNSEMRQMRQLAALSLLQQQSASDRLRGVSYSVRLQPADDEVLAALLAALNHDPNVNVRLAAFDALRQSGTRNPVRQGLREALRRQDSPLVQIALIDWAVEARDTASAAALRQLQREPELNPAVSSRLARALSQLE